MECTQGYNFTEYSFVVFTTNMEVGDFSMTFNWGKQQVDNFCFMRSTA